LQLLALFFSARGHLTPAPFARAVVVLYLLAFLSQLLISGPVLTHAGPGAFALVQGLAAWCWFCLHAKRLRDSGSDTGAALGIAVLYALAALLVMLSSVLIVELTPRDATSASSADPGDWFILFHFLGMLAGRSDAGLFGYVLLAVLLLSLLAIVIVVAFSVVAFTRPSAKRGVACQ
jgi:hypothetical protein